jgi:hypothetical protein
MDDKTNEAAAAEEEYSGTPRAGTAQHTPMGPHSPVDGRYERPEDDTDAQGSEDGSGDAQ